MFSLTFLENAQYASIALGLQGSEHNSDCGMHFFGALWNDRDLPRITSTFQAIIMQWPQTPQHKFHTKM